MSALSRFLLLLCILLPALKSDAKDSQSFLQGTIGNFPIALRISCYNDTDCSGSRYYYKKTLKDIVLEGTRKGKHYILGTSKDNTEAKPETFDLQEQADQSLTGTWTSGGKTLPVKLQPIRMASINNPNKTADKEILSDPYEYLRLSGLSFVRDSTTKYKDKELVWFHEKGSGMSFFRLGNGFSPVQLQKINPVLDEIHLGEAMSQLSCSSPWGGDIDFSVDISYLDDQLLGFHIFTSWDCGGAHPDFGGRGYLLELNTGRQFDIDDILAFDPSATTEARSGFDAFSKYRNDFFAPGLMALMIKAHGFESHENEEDCNYTDLEIWDFPSWEFGEKGISFTPIFARVMRACEEPFLLTFDQLKAYKNPKFPYNFPTTKK